MATMSSCMASRFNIFSTSSHFLMFLILRLMRISAYFTWFRYIECKPEHWRPGHSVQLKDIVDMNKIKMALYVTHTINFQNTAERGSRRSDLVLELKKIFEELSIIYHLLPQEVHVTYVGAPASSSVA